MASGRLWGRLTRRPEFLRVAASRRRWATPGLILQAADSRKVGGAVQRNRARRRLKAAAAALMLAHAARGMDYVLVARAETVSRPYPGLLADLEAALRRLRLWREDAQTAVSAADPKEVR